MKNLKERLLKDNQKTQMVLKEFSVRPEWSSIHTNSDKRNNVYYERRTQYWNKHIFWRDWPCTCPLGYLLFIQKLKEKWIQFLNILFLIQPGKRWNVLQGSLNVLQGSLKTRCILASNVRATRYFLSRNRSGLVMSEWPYSTNAEVATVNGGADYATSAQQKSACYVSPIRDTNYLYHIGRSKIRWQH